MKGRPKKKRKREKPSKKIPLPSGNLCFKRDFKKQKEWKGEKAQKAKKENGNTTLEELLYALKNGSRSREGSFKRSKKRGKSRSSADRRVPGQRVRKV